MTFPLILHVEAEIRIVLLNGGIALGVIGSCEEGRQGRKTVGASKRLRISDGVVVVEKVNSGFNCVRSPLKDKVVDGFAEVVETSGGGGRGSTEDGEAGDCDRGSVLVVGWSVQIVVAELPTRLIGETRRECGDIADGDGVVGVVDRCAVACFVQAPDAASVGAAELIQAVAKVELIVLTKAMVAAQEQGIGMECRWVETGRCRCNGKQRSLIPGCDKASIDDCGVCGCNGNDSRSIQPALLEVSEEEGAVFPQWAGETRSILALGQRKLVAGEGVVGVQTLVSQKSVSGSVQLVGAAPRDEVEIASECATELSLSSGGDDPGTRELRRG